jgi:hypothetical protein
MKKISFLISLIISGGALFLAFRNIPIFDLMGYLKTIHYGVVFPASLLVLAGFVVRALRWHMILMEIRGIGFSGVYHTLMIGFMLNCLLPGRVGEVLRPAILKKEENLPLSAGLSSVVLERVFDMLFMVITFALVLFFVDIDPGIKIQYASFVIDRAVLLKLYYNLVILSSLILFIIVLLWIPLVRNIVRKGIEKSSAVLPWVGRCESMLDNILSVFSILKSPGVVVRCVLTTCVVWGLVALSQYLLLKGCPGVDLNFFESTAVMIMVCFFIGIPSVPGFWGVWEAGGIFALSLFGVTGVDAAGFTLVNHTVQMIPVILAGLFSLFFYRGVRSLLLQTWYKPRKAA